MFHFSGWCFSGSAKFRCKYFGLKRYLSRKWWLSTMSRLWMILTFIIYERRCFLISEEIIKWSFGRFYFCEPCSRWPFCAFSPKCLTPPYSLSPPIVQWRVLETEAAATDVPSTSASGTSCEDVIMHDSSAVPGTSIGEHIGHASCIDCHQTGS